MMNYRSFLMIENPGECPPECLTIAGLSLADTCLDESKKCKIIGKFGSGAPNSIALLVRSKIAPIIFSSTTKLEFYSETCNVSDGIVTKDVERILMKSTKGNSTIIEKLGMTDDFGKFIWTETSLALREFVSNALDYCMRRFGNWDGVVVKLVDKEDVVQKEGYTRIFVPASIDVFDFYQKLDKWFLHFSGTTLDKQVLDKTDRNFSDKKLPVIYRRGVFVREADSNGKDGLFDYNFTDLELDEARKATDWHVSYAANNALKSCNDRDIIIKYMSNLTESRFENLFDDCYNYRIDQILWKNCFVEVHGNKVITTKEFYERVIKKGCVPLVLEEKVFNILVNCGIKSHRDILNYDEIEGFVIIDTPEEIRDVYLSVWNYLAGLNLTRNKVIPGLKVYIGNSEEGATTFGYYKDDIVYIKSDCSGQFLVKVMFEEIAHYITGAYDFTRDFQNFLFDIISSSSSNLFKRS